MGRNVDLFQPPTGADGDALVKTGDEGAVVFGEKRNRPERTPSGCKRILYAAKPFGSTDSGLADASVLLSTKRFEAVNDD